MKNNTFISSDKKPRALIIPKFHEEFCPLLVDRLHTIIERYCELNRFTIFTCLLDRSSQDCIDKKSLRLVGATPQREWLTQGKAPESNSKTRLLDICWKHLANSFVDKDNKLHKQWRNFKKGKIYLQQEDMPLFRREKHPNHYIKVRPLSDYFAFFNTKNKKDEDYGFKKPAYTILKYCGCDTSKGCFISIPLIQFGQIDGVLHIIFENTDNEKFSDVLIRLLIKALSLQYETLLLSWATEGLTEQAAEESLIDLSNLKNSHFLNNLKEHPILGPLEFEKYYVRSEKFHDKRIELGQEIPKKISNKNKEISAQNTEILRNYHKNAITAILIDSFAHNISAHSLTTLAWWFKMRGQWIQLKEKDKAAFKNQPPLVTEEIPFTDEVAHLMRFLIEKGALWTGLAREKNFGGKISNLYSVLWNDFVSNPLYLGTIASSEGILKLNIHLTIYETRDKSEPYGFIRKKTIKRAENGQLLSGEFAQIDLMKKAKTPEDLERDKKLEYCSHFITRGNLFEEFKSELMNYKAFFPAGLVGKHAFFTMIESEIRNIKHLTDIEDLKQKGLTLCISIEKSPCGDGLMQGEDTPQNRDNHLKLFKIGVWLKRRQDLSKDLLRQRLKPLGDKIYRDETYAPKLGGTFQDIVCAAMLFNGTFVSVQHDENTATNRNKFYYPWVKVGSSIDNCESETVTDFELSYRRIYNPEFGEAKNYFETHFDDFHQNQKGYLKKYIHLWRGNDVLEMDAVNQALFSEGWENPSRFRFVHTNHEKTLEKLFEANIIRIIDEKADDTVGAYRIWFDKWFKDKDNYCIHLYLNSTEICAILYDRGKNIQVVSSKFFETIKENYLNTHTIVFAHGQKEVSVNQCQFRNHGVLKAYFFANKEYQHANTEGVFNYEALDNLKAAELFEILMTRICIFDSRIAQRLDDYANKDLSEGLSKRIDEQLKLTIRHESLKEWQIIKEQGFLNYHFLVIHLSFIKNIKKPNGTHYKEGDIGEFIQEEILNYLEDVPLNFIFVITTGRGRSEWWSNVVKEEAYKHFTKFVTFQPIETLLECVEDGVNLRDDFEIKYRLTKALIGS